MVICVRIIEVASSTSRPSVLSGRSVFFLLMWWRWCSWEGIPVIGGGGGDAPGVVGFGRGGKLGDRVVVFSEGSAFGGVDGGSGRHS